MAMEESELSLYIRERLRKAILEAWESRKVEVLNLCRSEQIEVNKDDLYEFAIDGLSMINTFGLTRDEVILVWREADNDDFKAFVQEKLTA